MADTGNENGKSQVKPSNANQPGNGLAEQSKTQTAEYDEQRQYTADEVRESALHVSESYKLNEHLAEVQTQRRLKASDAAFNPMPNFMQKTRPTTGSRPGS